MPISIRSKFVCDLGGHNCLLKRLHHIGHKIQLILDTTAYPYEVIENTSRLALLTRNAAVRHSARDFDE